MKGKSPLSALLVPLLLATSIVQSVHTYENTQFGFSVNPPEGWAIEEKKEPTLFVFKDPSNYTGATISILVNQSGLSQEDPFLASLKESYLRHYLSQTYEGYLITEKGARAPWIRTGFFPRVRRSFHIKSRHDRFCSR